MAFLDRFKKTDDQTPAPAQPAAPSVTKKVAVDTDEPKPAKKAEKETKRVVGNAHRVLMHPMVTEKSADVNALNKYIFAVAPSANKITVSRAITQVYGVVPQAVNMMCVRGKKVRYGRSSGKTKAWKKAIITLKKGESISIYEGI